MNGKSMKQFGNKAVIARNFIYDLVFPKRCLSCNKFDDFVCSDCLHLLRVKANFCCPTCNREMILPSVCSDCFDKSSLEKLWVVSDYENELTKKAIHLIKYNFCEQVSEVWDRLIIMYFERERLWPKEALLVPVPLHKKRYLERGFNQSVLIGKIVERIKGNSINNNIIKRVLYGKHQATLDYKARIRSMDSCFALAQSGVSGIDLNREIILIDDVYTTGATMQECARTLKRAGFQRVYGFAMARG